MDNEEVPEDDDAVEEPIDGERAGDCPVCDAPLYALFDYPWVQATCAHYLGETWQPSRDSDSGEDAGDDMPADVTPLYESLVRVRDAVVGARERLAQPTSELAALNLEFKQLVGESLDDFIEYGSPLTMASNLLDGVIRDTPQILITDRMGWGPNPAAPFDMWAQDPETAWNPVSNRLGELAESLRRLEIKARTLVD